MPFSKWCQLTGDANVGRNAEKEHQTSITMRGGGPGSCPPHVRENCPGRGGEAAHNVNRACHCRTLIPQYKNKYHDQGNAFTFKMPLFTVTGVSALE